MKKKVAFLFLALNSIIGYSNPTISNDEKPDTLKLYYRHLNLNHMSPYFDYVGHNPITEAQAKNVNHYCFAYFKDTLRSITEIGADYSWIIHPLLLIGSERVDYFYSPNKVIRKYLNLKGEPYPNYKGVYIEELTLDNNGRKKSLKYFDYKMQPMQGIWNISEYNWEKKDTLIIEKRKNLKGEYVDVAPYFPFRFSALRIDSIKHTITHYNIDNNNHIINDTYGIACYMDNENINGDLLKWSYFNANGKPVVVHTGYSTGEYVYYDDGSIKQVNFYYYTYLGAYNSFTYDNKGNVTSYDVFLRGEKQEYSTSADISGFSIKNQIKEPIINNQNHTVEVYLPKGTNLTYIVPSITVSKGAFIHPSSEIPVNFRNNYYRYTVIAENTTIKQEWKVILYEE